MASAPAVPDTHLPWLFCILAFPVFAGFFLWLPCSHSVMYSFLSLHGVHYPHCHPLRGVPAPTSSIRVQFQPNRGTLTDTPQALTPHTPLSRNCRQTVPLSSSISHIPSMSMPTSFFHLSHLLRKVGMHALLISPWDSL